MIADIKLFGLFILGAVCIVLKIMTKPIVMLHGWAESKQLANDTLAKK
jgi:hypothetical protein